MEIAANERSENKIIVNYYRLILFTGSEVGYMILGGRGGGRGAVIFSLPSTPQQLGFSCWGAGVEWRGAVVVPGSGGWDFEPSGVRGRNGIRSCMNLW